MRRFWTWSTVAATAASLGIAGLALRASATVPSQTAPLAAAPGGGFMAKGAGSCAASNCHGSPNRHEGEPILHNEHTTWVTADAHSRAYDALLTDRSKSIAHLLSKGKPETKAHEDARCLACHVTPSAPTVGAAATDLVDTIRRDGVGCESCHGPAQDWLAAHTTFGWKDRNDKASTGFADMRNYSTRAQTCAGCHVGAPADPLKNLPLRDVNHDLIAAGHPRLNWEFSAYAANTPKHWKTPTSEAGDLDARLWKIGQVASLNAAADLLHDRALRASANKAPWPELSEYGCFSCHFGLKPKTDLLHATRDPAVNLGMPAWGSWHVPMVKILAENGPGAPPPTVGESLSALRAEMNALNSDTAIVARKADAMKAILSEWLKTLPENRLSEREVRSLIAALNVKDAKSGQMKVVTGWDSAAQRYLALAALHASQGRMAAAGEDKKLRAELEAMLKDLKFLDGYDSPRREK